jgi:hypothetical protein
LILIYDAHRSWHMVLSISSSSHLENHGHLDISPFSTWHGAT